MKLLALTLLLLSGCIVPLPPYVVSGTVRSPSGEPIANATVELCMWLWTPLCCDQNAILQLTRTDEHGRYRFAMGADRDFQFAPEFRDYTVVVVHDLYDDGFARAEGSNPIDLVLKPREVVTVDRLYLCFELAYGGFANLRRAAEFHFGDKTYCDEWWESIH